MANPLDIHPVLARQLFGPPKVRARDRFLHAKAVLRQAQEALARGDKLEAIQHLEHAVERLRRAVELEAQQ